MFDICVRINQKKNSKITKLLKNLLVDMPDSIENVPEKIKNIKSTLSWAIILKNKLISLYKKIPDHLAEL